MRTSQFLELWRAASNCRQSEAQQSAPHEPPPRSLLRPEGRVLRRWLGIIIHGRAAVGALGRSASSLDTFDVAYREVMPESIDTLVSRQCSCLPING